MLFARPRFRTTAPVVYLGWNSADKDADITLSNGNLTASIDSPNMGAVRGVTGHSTGYRQFEYTFTNDGSHLVGIANLTASLSNYPGSDANGWAWYSYPGYSSFYNNAASTPVGIDGSVGDVVSCVYYATEGELVFYKNGKIVGLAFTGLSGTMYPAWGPGGSTGGNRTCTINTGVLTHPIGGVTNWGGSNTPAVSSTWNASDKDADINLYAANTLARLVAGGNDYGAVRGSLGRSSGVYQCEFVALGNTEHLVGLSKATASLTNFPGHDSNGYGYYNGAAKYNNGSQGAYGATWTLYDVIGVKWDATAGEITFYKNGVSQGVAFSGVSGTLYPSWGPGTGGTGTRFCHLNTGQMSFLYPISGATAWGADSTVTATWNPSDKHTNVTLSGANRVSTYASSGAGSVRATQVYASGDKYFEITVSSAATELVIGVGTSAAALGNPPGTSTTSWGYYAPLGRGYHNGAFTFTGASYTVGDVIGVRFNGTTITWYKNGVSQGTATPGVTALYPFVGTAAGGTPNVVCTLNMGASEFKYPISGVTGWGA